MTHDLYRRGMAAPPDHRTVARCLLNYAWDPRRDGEPLKDGVYDHGADAVRYFVREWLWQLGEAAAVVATARPQQRREPSRVRGAW